jgi:hypothetical protein
MEEEYEYDIQDPLFVSNKCNWPNCELARLNPDFEFESFPEFMVHLNTEHCLGEKTHDSALKQLIEIESIEWELMTKKRFLRFMLCHLNRLYREQSDTNPAANQNVTEREEPIVESSASYNENSTFESAINRARRCDAIQFEKGKLISNKNCKNNSFDFSFEIKIRL